jgi:Uma2 family endonuclease
MRNFEDRRRQTGEDFNGSGRERKPEQALGYNRMTPNSGEKMPPPIGKVVPAMATVSKKGPPASPESITPPLETGDRLSRAEFERRYTAMPELKRAELIEGVVHVPSPVHLQRHAEPHFDFIIWLGTYKWATPGLRGADNATTRLDLDNEPQPDACLFIDPARGGQARVTPDDYLEDAPELVAEIAASSVSYDLNTKLNVYRRNGVREYIVWRVLDRQIDWFVLREGEFVRLPLDDASVYRSEVYPGLWLDPAALVRGDTQSVQTTLQRGLASREHADFVKKLNPEATP